jgi:hypothetical protein
MKDELRIPIMFLMARKRFKKGRGIKSCRIAQGKVFPYQGQTSDG